MEGKQFSTSRGHSIYVRDFLDRYDPDPLRYYLSPPGPETQDTDFTWAEFVRRNNDELLANWGNLVNRTLTNAHRNFGAVPEPGELTADDQALLATVDAGFDDGRRADRGAAASAPRSREAMRLSSRSTSTSATRRRGRSSRPTATAPARSSTSSLRAVDSLKMIFTPFLPHTSQHAPRAARLRRAGSPARSSSARSTRRTAARTRCSPATTPAGPAAGSRASSPPGQALREPQPLFRKLDESIVDDELARMRARRRVIDTHAHLDRDDAADGPRARPRRRRRPRDRRRDHDRRRARGARARRAARRRLRVPRHPPARGRRARRRRSTSCASCSRIRRAVAVGETGLDYFRDYAPHDAQRRLFDAQLALAARARQAGRHPHARRRRGHARAAARATTGTVVLHCFSSPALLDAALERGWYVSFAGNVTYQNASELRDAARARAARPPPRRDRQPVPRAAARARASATSPRTSTHTLDVLAELRGEDDAELARRSTRTPTPRFGL